jgi:hypothetical protein
VRDPFTGMPSWPGLFYGGLAFPGSLKKAANRIKPIVHRVYSVAVAAEKLA